VWSMVSCFQHFMFVLREELKSASTPIVYPSGFGRRDLKSAYCIEVRASSGATTSIFSAGHDGTVSRPDLSLACAHWRRHLKIARLTRMARTDTNCHKHAPCLLGKWPIREVTFRLFLRDALSIFGFPSTVGESITVFHFASDSISCYL
jgi:hypothetical protein